MDKWTTVLRPNDDLTSVGSPTSKLSLASTHISGSNSITVAPSHELVTVRTSSTAVSEVSVASASSDIEVSVSVTATDVSEVAVAGATHYYAVTDTLSSESVPKDAVASSG